MRKFIVYLDKGCVGRSPIEETIELPDSATDEECDEACRDCLQTMIGNEIDSGWHEVVPKPKKSTRKR